MLGKGSQWRRWEPHIHAPGTVLNNQFGSKDPWESYLSSLETSSPRIEALAVTDYYLTDTYEVVLKHKAAGRLPDVKLILPNVELRLDAAAKSGFVNVHLLVSPERDDHLEQLHRILQRLQFHAHDDSFNCTRADLIALGRRADPRLTDDKAALAYGVTQFKVSFSQLRTVLAASEFAKANILVAVAGAAGDGTSGLRQAADTTVRQEIEKFAHIIFSSSPSQRDFWLGYKGVSAEELKNRYDGCKPCLHGSDAHDQNTVGKPVEDRFSWVKGGLEFDALRQACIDPEGRAYVGTEPPRTAMPSQVIAEVTIRDGDWAATPSIPFNAGLVAIIGARGSGKTALADLIAAGCDAMPPVAWDASKKTMSPSFLVRARPLLGDATATLTWGGGDVVERYLDGRDADQNTAYPRARYLSQQFVEDLCSSDGISDGLLDEIERVIFEAHPIDDRDGALDFGELREFMTSRFQQARERDVDAIEDLSDRIAVEFEKERSVAGLQSLISQKQGQIDSYNADLGRLVLKGTEAEAARHALIGRAVQTVREAIQVYTNRRRTLQGLQDEVASTRTTKAPEMLRQARERHLQSNLNDQEWDDFLLDYKGKVDDKLTAYLEWTEKQIGLLTGPAVASDDKTPYFSETADLKTLPLNTLQAEMNRLAGLISVDTTIRKQYTALSQRITQENAALKTLKTRLTDASDASKRRKDLQKERDDAYGRVFQAVINEEQALTELYTPLMQRLAASSGTLGRLGFTVKRIVDVGAWGAFAEEHLLDRRKTGPFQGRGSLINLAESTFRRPWETGSASDVQAAMAGFINTYLQQLIGHAPYDRDQLDDYREWLNKFAHWLFNTDHITVRYEIVYDGTDIRKLSPGTRGIVLLLLYLALDDADDRPLIIDQPEENLDPKSVYEELVSLFIAAKSKRQVIMVTHNANLVINTDADQIIIANAGPHTAGGLPPITYTSGGLENADIRKAVCDILEGGEQAFQERARRLRVRLDR